MKDELTKRRFEDLADKAFKSNHYTFTSFLTEAELSEFYTIKHLSPSSYTIWGGRENADRVMIRFGNPEELGYAEEFPIKCVAIEPLSKKFAEEHGFNVVGDGTSWSFFTEGARLLGLDSVPITPEAQRIFDNLAVGNPIVCIMGPGDFTTTGHFILLAGTEDGKVRVNDPNSVRNSEKLWDVETIIEQAQAMWVLR